MKKSTKIILPALALLVLGTTAAATSTVAWFAANGTVSATGMQVNCQTSHNLIISNLDPFAFDGSSEEGKQYGSEVSSMNNVTRSLMPASTGTTVLDAKTPKHADSQAAYTDSVADKFFYTATGTKIDAVSGKVVSGSTLIATKEGDDNKYFAQHDFWVANSATVDMNIAISSFKVTKSDGQPLTANISKALRVGIVYQDRTKSNTNWVGIYHAVSGATTEYDGFIKAGAIKTVPATSTERYTDTSGDPMSERVKSTLVNDSISIGKIARTENAVTSVRDYIWSKFTVYVWYEGQDANCTSNFAMSVEDVSVSLALTANETTTPSQGQGGVGQ